MSDVLLLTKVTVVLAAALGLRWYLSRASAAVRGLILTAGFAGVVALPVATVLSPAITVTLPEMFDPVPSSVVDGQRVVMPVLLPPQERTSLPVDASRGPDADTRAVSRLDVAWSAAVWISVIWISGALVCAATLVIALLRTSRIRRRASVWSVPLPAAAVDARHSVGRPVAVLVSDELVVPMACGVWTPAVVLPRDAERWSDEQVANAMLHELEHLRRQDWAVFVAARLTCALYWWHPLVWAAWRRLRVDAEQACDDAVVLKMDRTAYAQQLVSIARRVSGHGQPLIAMARSSDLSQRVAAVLDSTRVRKASTARMALRAVGVALVTSLLAGAVQVVGAQDPRSSADDLEPQRRAPVGAPAGHFTGVVLDPTGVPVPGLLLIVGPEPCRTRTERSNCSFDGTWERTDRFGRFRFERLPVGRFHLVSQVDYFPGEEFSIARDETTEQTITMRVLPLEQEFTICAQCPPLIVSDSLAKEFAADAIDALDHPVSAPRPAAGWELYAPGNGVYPPELLDDNVQGSVVVEGTIGVDGVPSDMKVDVAAHPRLARAAMTALAAEVWEPGRIRGTAVEVPFRFLIRYSVTGGRDLQNAAPPPSSPVRFEVASVKRTTDPDAPLGIQPVTGGRFKAIATVRLLIQVAYGGPDALFDAQVVGGPGWAGTDRFEINAVLDGPMAATSGGPPDRLLAMMRALLTDRFNLRLRGETRQLPVYDLVLDRADGRTGPRLTRASGSCLPISAAIGPVTDFTRYCGFKRAGPNAISGRGIAIGTLAGALAFNADVQRSVRDRTGLSGEFDLDLEYTPGSATEPQAGVTLFTALREQLGLSLKATTGTVGVLVVENVEPPTPD